MEALWAAAREVGEGRDTTVRVDLDEPRLLLLCLAEIELLVAVVLQTGKRGTREDARTRM